MLKWKVICCSLWSKREWGGGGGGGGGLSNGWTLPLGGDPGVAQALCSRGPLLWDEIQHG